jgi:hypothetical protein
LLPHQLQLSLEGLSVSEINSAMLEFALLTVRAARIEAEQSGADAVVNSISREDQHTKASEREGGRGERARNMRWRTVIPRNMSKRVDIYRFE